MTDCIFCKIAQRKVPKEFTYEDEEVMVFPDIHPVKPIHLLVVPKMHITDIMDVSDDALWNKMRVVAQQMVKKQHLEKKGFKLLINGGGAQAINHLHLHLIGPLGKAAEL